MPEFGCGKGYNMDTIFDCEFWKTHERGCGDCKDYDWGYLEFGKSEEDV